MKASNRKSEVLIRDVEILATMASLAARKKNSAEYKYESIYHTVVFDVFNVRRYPADDITKIWKLVCLNQFHDCLPGSAIGLAYKDVHKVTRLQTIILRSVVLISFGSFIKMCETTLWACVRMLKMPLSLL